MVPVSAGSFTILPEIFGQMPPATVVVADLLDDDAFEVGLLGATVVSDVSGSLMTAPLTAGGEIDFGIFTSIAGSLKLMDYK